jgi:ADP-heptose:LPS heptosyltransferase
MVTLTPCCFGHPNDTSARSGLARFRRALEQLPPGAEGHIWVRLPIQLGDMMMALPSLFAVKAAWEGWAARAGRTLRFTVTGKRSVSLFQEAVPQVFAACHVDDEFPCSGSPLKLLRHWGRERPLALINYSKSDRIKLAAWLGRVPVRAGISEGSNTWSYHFHHSFQGFAQWGHMSFRYLPLTRWLAGPDTCLRMERLEPSRFGGGSVTAVLREQGWDGGPYVVFAPYPLPQFPERQWFPLDQPWLRLARLARADGYTPVLAGGPERREALDRLAAAAGCLSLGGRTTLPQLMALAADAAGTISVDTGIAHVAAATGAPTVVIFGWGSENKDIPCGPRVVSLRGDPAGAPVHPVPPGSMDQASCPWSAASASIPAERAWGVLAHLAREAVPDPSRTLNPAPAGAR